MNNHEIHEVGLAGISSQDESSQKHERDGGGIVRKLLELKRMVG